MKQDISNRKDIELLVDTFYKKVKTDKLIGSFFTDIITVNWEKHLPIMYKFWDNVIFFTGEYEGNPTMLHHHLSKLKNIEKKHFQRWNKLFSETVDELFDGEKASTIKRRATSISAIMQKNIFTKKS